MDRKWLKHLVPLFALVLTGLLLAAGRQQEREIEAWGGYGSYDGPPPAGPEIAVALNLPAVLVGIPGGLLLGWALGIWRSSTLALWQATLFYAYFSLLVVAQWVLIGRWVAQLHKPNAAITKRLGLQLFTHAIGIVISLSLVWRGVVSIKHSGWMSSWISGAGVIAWFLIITMLLTARMRMLLASRNQSKSFFA